MASTSKAIEGTVIITKSVILGKWQIVHVYAVRNIIINMCTTETLLKTDRIINGHFQLFSKFAVQCSYGSIVK